MGLKLWEFPLITTIADDDVIAVGVDPAGSPVLSRMTYASLKLELFGASVTIGGNLLMSVGLVQMGGTSSSSSAFKGSGNIVDVRLADDSDYGRIRAFGFLATSGFSIATTVGLETGGLQFQNSYSILWSSDSAYYGTPDIGLKRSAAGILRVTDGSTGYGKLELADTVRLIAGSGSPEGAVTAKIGSIYMRTDGGAVTSLYVKESGTGNTGWAAK